MRTWQFIPMERMGSLELALEICRRAEMAGTAAGETGATSPTRKARSGMLHPGLACCFLIELGKKDGYRAPHIGPAGEAAPVAANDAGEAEALVDGDEEAGMLGTDAIHQESFNLGLH